MLDLRPFVRWISGTFAPLVHVGPGPADYTDRVGSTDVALYGTADRVAEQVAELRDAGAHHLLCQLSCGYLPHAAIMESMRRFGAHVIPRFR